jgi:hypothetical protein
MYNLEDIDLSNLKIRIRDTIKTILGWYKNKTDEKELLLLEINTFIFMEFLNQYNYVHSKKKSLFLDRNKKNIYIIFLNNSYKTIYDEIDNDTLLKINNSNNSYYHKLSIIFKNAETINIEKSSIISKNYGMSQEHLYVSKFVGEDYCIINSGLENINPYVIINCSIEICNF